MLDVHRIYPEHSFLANIFDKCVKTFDQFEQAHHSLKKYLYMVVFLNYIKI